MNRRRKPLGPASTLAVLVAGVTVTACTSSGGATPAANPTSSRSAPVRSAPSLPPATAIPNTVARRRDVALTACRSAAGGWQATGTAMNRTAQATTYLVTVFFTNAGATVVGFARTSVSTPAHGTVSWRAAARFPAPGTTRCVLRGVG